jgi:putative tryptophan/tyrosine transport system substrate-binding protein
LEDIQAAARDLGIEIRVVSADSEEGINIAFATIDRLGSGALLIGADPMFYSQRSQITSLARRYATPTIYELRGYVMDGGLISYGPNLFEMYRSVGDYTGKILNGAKPGDLPVIQSLKLELVINLKTAKELSLEISPATLAQADEVIE